MNLPFKINLNNKTVAITGAGGVLMSEFAKALACCGAKVALIDINEKSVLSVQKSIEQLGGEATAYVADCLDKKSLYSAKEQITKKYGKVNFLINGAGGNNPEGTTEDENLKELKEGVKNFFKLTDKGLRFVFDLNILTAFLSTQVFAEDMIEGGGNIINISSMNAYRPLTKIPAYSAAKAGISNFTQWLAVYFAPCNIRVNAIAPGFFVTNQNRTLLFDKEDNKTERSKKILSHTPMNRFGEVEDLLGTLLFLADDKASAFITGTVIPVDGGFSAYSGV